MLDRKRLVSTIRLTSLLAMLAWVLVAPMGMTGFGQVASPPDRLLPDFASGSVRHEPGLTAAMPEDSVPRVKAISTEDEEQERTDALDEPEVSFLIPCSLRKVTDRQFIAPCAIPSLYPLRC